MQARLAHPSKYLVSTLVLNIMLKTSEQARRLGTCYSKSGPRRPQRLSSKCPGDTNCDSQIAKRPDSNLPPTTRTTLQRRTQTSNCCRRQPAEERQNSQPKHAIRGQLAGRPPGLCAVRPVLRRG